MTSTLDQAVSTLTSPQGAVILVLTCVVISWAARKKQMNLPPGPPTYPLIGNLLEMRELPLHQKCLEWKKKYGPVVTFYTGPYRWIALNSLETMTEALSERGVDYADKPRLTSLDYISHNGTDLALSNYSQDFLYRRKIAMTALRQYLTGEQHAQRVHAVVTESVRHMKAIDGPFDPHKYLCYIIFNILHGICFGHSLKMDDPKYKEMLDFYDGVFGQGGSFMEDFFPPLRHFPTKRYRQFKKDVDFFVGYCSEQVRKRRAIFDENNLQNLVDNILMAQKQASASEIEAIKTGFTDAHVAYLIVDVFFAGVESSRDTLEWTILTLIVNQKVQNRIHEEVDAVIGGAMPSRKHRADLIYTEATVMEVLRRHPVVPMGIPRVTRCDTKVGGYDIPAKTNVVVNQLDILNNPDFWDSPETFMPERFIEPDGDKIKLKTRQKHWIPFSIGPRSCMGELLARTSQVFVLAGLLQKLHFDIPPGTGMPDVTPQNKWLLLSCKHYQVVVTPRKSLASS